MARLRRDTLPVVAPPPLRIFATGAVFLTHSLLLPAHPSPGSVSRAQSVHSSRGGAAPHVLALLAQLAATVPAAGDIEPMLIASLGNNPDALRLRDALEAVGVRTKYCKIWPGLGVPTAWVVHARDTDARTVINHNPLPEVSHEDFITLLGPVLAPENYVGFNVAQPVPNPPPVPRDQRSPSPVATFPNALTQSAPPPPPSSRPNTAPSTTNAPPPAPHSYSIPSQNPHSPAPFDWLHFDGRSVRTTIANLVGLDGLARERKWRSHCVISVDLGRRAREGVQVLIPHADVIFLNTTTFSSLSGPPQPGHPVPPEPGVAPSPRAILLSLARHAPSHALLVLNAGRDGAALLSLPTSEYLQSSGWTQLFSTRSTPGHGHSASNATSNGTRTGRTWDGAESVRSGSDFWAGGGPTDSSFASRDSAYTQHADGRSHHRLPSGESFHPMDDDDDEEQGEDGEGEDGRRTPQPERGREVEEDLDEEGAHAAFVAGMIWALSRRVLPGPPYVPGLGQDGEAKGKDGAADVGIRWRLEECLRFATELACRKAHVRADDVAAASVSSSSGYVKERDEWDGLGEAMRKAGWFD